jgi:uncharacterized protein YqeY
MKKSALDIIKQIMVEVENELPDALKSGQTDKVETLRFLMSDIKNEEINTKKNLNDDEITSIINKSVKKLRDASEMFTKGGRNDLVEQNQIQINILSSYLPTQLSDEELTAEIQKIISDNKELYDANPKAIIGIAMKSLSSRADPQRIMKALS